MRPQGDIVAEMERLGRGRTRRPPLGYSIILSAMRRSLSLIVPAAILAGCGMFSGSGGPPAAIDKVTLADDGRSLRVDFIGGREFDPNDPCSIDYQGTAKIVRDELEIGVYAQKHPIALSGGAACTMEGHGRSLNLTLNEPFTGTVVHDLAGQRLLLAPPSQLAEVRALPDGWELRREESLLGSLTPRWQRIWSPDRDPWQSDGDSMLTLIQAFGGPVEITGGHRVSSVEIHGQPATLALDTPSGELLLVWSLGEDELALTGNLRDFSRDEFLSLAESVAFPPK
jgi:hypothetical protein